MSAVQINKITKGSKNTFSFEQTHLIPSYLIALAVGDLRYQKIGKRTGVVSEPS